MNDGQLYPRVPLGEDESATSFVSRLAKCNRVKSARTLCFHMGLDFQGIINGREDTLSALARLVDAPLEALTAGAFRRAGNDSLLRGERLTKPVLRRAHLHVCPACLKEDVATAGLAPEVAVYGRTTWLLAPIRTCPVHGLALVEAAVGNSSQTAHDFSLLVSPLVGDLDRLANGAVSRAPSGMETFLLDRLTGASGRFLWLDRLEFYAAAKACEMFGALSLFGPTPNLKCLSEDDWHAAGAAGFEICSKGVAGIRNFLSDIQHEHPYSKRATDGPQAIFGRVYQWLDCGAQDACFDPVRDILRTHIIETIPVGAGEKILGQTVDRRRLHSIRSATTEFGLHGKRLRKILALKGIIANGHDALPDNRVIFDADQAIGVLERITNSVSLHDAGVYLNAGRAQVRLLEKNGFITPFVSCDTDGIKGNLFTRRDLDAFLAELWKDAIPVAKAGAGMHNIPAVSKHAKCTAEEVLNLILCRKLARIERLEDVPGYLSVIVDADEIKRNVRGPELDGLTAEMIQKEMRTSHRVVKALLENGLLTWRTVIHPIIRCPVGIVARTDFEAFQNDYVALFDLVKQRGRHQLKIKAELGAKGILPALEGKKYGATFYRRADLL